MQSSITAAILIIGNEILFGEVADTNSQFLSKELTSIGIFVKKILVVADQESEISDAVTNLSKEYDYLFTTGGIGPTHDDITTKTITNLFNLELVMDKSVAKQLTARSLAKGQNQLQLESVLKMAYLPKNAQLINNPISGAPGFIINNIYVLAGVPCIMQAMFLTIKSELKQGKKIHSLELLIPHSEGLIAHEFDKLQSSYPQLLMGSYPQQTKEDHSTLLVIKGTDLSEVNEAHQKLITIIKQVS